MPTPAGAVPVAPTGAILPIRDAAHFRQAVLEADVPVLVEFSAERCAPCRAQTPVLDSLAHELRGQLRVVAVDADAHPELAAAYQVRGIPTLLFMAGGRVVEARVGLTPHDRLRAAAERLLAARPA